MQPNLVENPIPQSHSANDHEKNPLAKVSLSTFNGKIILFAQRKERSFHFSKRKSEKNLISWGIWTTLHTATCQNCGCVKWLYALLFGKKIVVIIVTHCAWTIRVVQFRRRWKKNWSPFDSTSCPTIVIFKYKFVGADRLMN